MQAARAPTEHWPLAVRHASEMQFGAQLGSLGIPVEPILLFGVIGYARKKKWDERLHAWRSPRVFGGQQVICR